jgi:hypothetical protein
MLGVTSMQAPHTCCTTAPQANPKIKNLASSKALAAKAASSNGKGVVRQAAGKRWFDPTLGDWPENDFRIFVGDIGNEVNDDSLGKAFSKYSSFAMAKVGCCCYLLLVDLPAGAVCCLLWLHGGASLLTLIRAGVSLLLLSARRCCLTVLNGLRGQAAAGQCTC